jgi:hypothetical protein
VIVSVRWPTRGNSQDDVATEEAQIWPVTKPGNVRLVAEPRPLVYRDGAIRIYIDAVAPKARSAIHENTSTKVESSRSDISCSVAPRRPISYTSVGSLGCGDRRAVWLDRAPADINNIAGAATRR